MCLTRNQTGLKNAAFTGLSLLLLFIFILDAGMPFAKAEKIYIIGIHQYYGKYEYKQHIAFDFSRLLLLKLRLPNSRRWLEILCYYN